MHNFMINWAILLISLSYIRIIAVLLLIFMILLVHRMLMSNENIVSLFLDHIQSCSNGFHLSMNVIQLKFRSLE